MNALEFSTNLVHLRKGKKLTQEILADFMGVTKASVSKWETGQCLPDILLLPQLAAFFDITIDELIGYKPQLSSEQIQKLYLSFTAAFAERPFDEVLAEVRKTAKQYYSCYPLLLQLCVLYLNHVSLAGDAAKATAILQEARELCCHILSGCKQTAICEDAISLKAVFDLQLGDTNAVIEAMEPMCDPKRISGQNDGLLIQAYHLAGQQDKAIDFIQVSIYLHILSLVGISTQYLAADPENRATCYTTIKRVDAVSEAYHLASLHPNLIAQFQYQCVLTCLAMGDTEEAEKRLGFYGDAVFSLIDADGYCLHGDDYFDRLGHYIDGLALGANPPRDRSFISQNVVASLMNPALKPLQNGAAYKKTLKKIGGK